MQPIFGPQLIPLVKQAIKNGIKVVNVDQILGHEPGNGEATGRRHVGQHRLHPDGHRPASRVRSSVAACKANNLNPCNVGYLYSVKVSSLDTAIRKGFDAVIKAVPSIKVVAEGETFYQHAVALKAAQTMLQAQPDINLIVGADQGATGAEQAPAAREIVLVGYGGGRVGLNAVKAGRWFGTVMQRPTTEGQRGMQCAIAAVKTAQQLRRHRRARRACPNGGIVTKANASKFKAEWPG